MFPTPPLHLHSVHELWLFALLGLLCGVVGLAMTKSLFWLDDCFDRLPLRPVAVWAPTLGALILGGIGYLVPQVFGTSYDTIRAMLRDSLASAALLRISFAKFWALVISLGSGTTGGVFAPSLVVGGGLGAAFAAACHHLLPAVSLSPPALYALTAMAAVFGCIARAPFTAIVFLFELSHDPSAVLPLIVCVMMADGLMRLFSPDSMMTGKLARRGLIVSQDYVAPQFQLWTTEASDIMEPVLTTEGESNISALLETPQFIEAHPGDSVAAIAHRLLEQHADYAVVMDGSSPPQPVGVVRIADILALEEEILKTHPHRG